MIFATFLEELEARTAIEDCLKRFADRRVTASARYLDRFERRNGAWRVAHRTLVFGDMVPEPMAEPPRFPPEFTVQKHGMDDPLYRLKR